jgi:hypothetical protein
MAIDEGVSTGYYRSFKHDEDPTPEAIIENIQEAVMSKMYEYFDFPEETFIG